MKDYYTKLGLMLKDLRVSKHMSQQQVADKIGKTKAIVSYWESGDRKINIGDLWLFTEALGLTEEEKEAFYKKAVKLYNPKMYKTFGFED